MEIKYGDSIEFARESDKNGEPVGNELLEKKAERKSIVRKVFRYPVSHLGAVSVKISADVCPIVNVGLQGVGAYLAGGMDVRAGDLLEDIVLDLGENVFKTNGKVIHLSRESSNILCGIELISPDKKCLEALAELIEKSKKSFFTKSRS